MAVRTLTDLEKKQAAASGVSETDLTAELGRYSGLNVDAAIGNLLSRKPSAPSAPITPIQTQEQVPGVGTVTRIPKTITQPVVAPVENTAGMMARAGVTPPPPPTGATLISGPSGLQGLTEAQIWREPGTNRIFRLPTATPTPSQVTTPTPTAPTAPAGGAAGKQFYRIGSDIFEAGTNRKLGPTEWNNDWTGRATEVAAPSNAPDKPTPEFGGNLITKDANYADQLINIFQGYSAKMDELEKKMAAGYMPSEEEKALQAEFQRAKEGLRQFDLDTLKRVEGMSGQGRGFTLATVARMQDKERRMAALDRLGLAQELEAYAERLSTAQDQRKTAMDYAKGLFDVSAKRLDIALGISKEINNISRQQRDDARAFILDTIEFANGMAFEDLSPAAQQAITKQVANSPLTLDMVKMALKTAKEKPDRDFVQRLALEYPDAGILLTDTPAIAQAKIKKSPMYIKGLRTGASGGGKSKSQTFLEGAGDTLNSSRGVDGFVNTATYGQKYQEYLMQGGKPADFFNIFPPEQYLNPQDATAQFYRDKADNSGLGDLAR